MFRLTMQHQDGTIEEGHHDEEGLEIEINRFFADPRFMTFSVDRLVEA